MSGAGLLPFLPDPWLAPIFAVLMGVSMLLYAVLDGFDLGVGILLRATPDEDERDRMVASIGPFWDANETWLVLGVGLLLVAFPTAHGIILTALYLPVALMLAGLILRGVAFEFRAKAVASQKPRWDVAFQFGSILTAAAQGWMLGDYILGFPTGWAGLLFGIIIGIGVVGGFALLGATWLVWRAESTLQVRAVGWARTALVFAALGIGIVSVATPWVSPEIFARWFRLPELLMLAPIPLATLGLFALAWVTLGRLPRRDHSLDWVPFAAATGITVLCFHGLAYSFWPYVVPGQMTIWQAASAPEALRVILIGAMIVLPMILGYTVFVWRVFGGKAGALRYE
jgi:cytochrome d ubiquinol oxidase subunit II